MLEDNVMQKRMSSFLDQKLKGYDFLILENKNYGWVSFVSAMLLSSLHSGARRVSTKSKPLQFPKMKTKVIWNMLSETDIISKRKPMLLKLFLKRYPVCVLSFLCANLHIGSTVM